MYEISELVLFVWNYLLFSYWVFVSLFWKTAPPYPNFLSSACRTFPSSPMSFQSSFSQSFLFGSLLSTLFVSIVLLFYSFFPLLRSAKQRYLKKGVPFFFLCSAAYKTLCGKLFIDLSLEIAPQPFFASILLFCSKTRSAPDP